MPGSDFSTLDQAVSDLKDQVGQTETVEASAEALINGFDAQMQKAVTDALAADDAADQGSIDAATQAMAAVTARFKASAGALGNAVATVIPPVS